jgi:hypothetical protein
VQRQELADEEAHKRTEAVRFQLALPYFV